VNAHANVAAARTRLLDTNLDGSMTCNKGQVAQLLGISDRTFDRIRGSLTNFPGKLPGIERWSRPAVVAWIRSNGQPANSQQWITQGDLEIELLISNLEDTYRVAS